MEAFVTFQKDMSIFNKEGKMTLSMYVPLEGGEDQLGYRSNFVIQQDEPTSFS